MRRSLLITCLLLMLSPISHGAQNCMPEGASFPAAWFENYPPHRVIGPLYSVGGKDLSVFLITTSDGHILINTGMSNSTAQIKANLDELGFDMADVKILLVQQSHFDHAAALAEIKSLTGAELWATEQDAPILEDGGASDPHFGDCLDFRFAPIKVDKTLQQGSKISLGGVTLTTHLHPGHTEGSSSYTLTHEENGKTYNVVIANMGSINEGKQLLNEPTYPNVAADFANTFAAQLALPVDVWVAAHASQYKRDAKHQPGQAYDAEAFVDPEGFRSAVSSLQGTYEWQLAVERAEKN
jgi:metallo-beta-lactamase class B